MEVRILIKLIKGKRMLQKDGSYGDGLEIKPKRKNLSKEMRNKIKERDNFKCCNCGKRFVYLEIDHIIPVCEGGNNDESNLQTLCSECNRQKEFNRRKNNDIK